MDWFEIKFPQDISPFSEPESLKRQAQEIYEASGFPKGYAVFQEIKNDGGFFLYFSPVACDYCEELFKSYRGVHRDKPVKSDNPIIWVVGELITQSL